MKNILILAGTGFIGKNIIDSYLSNSEVQLIVVARNVKSIDKDYLSSKNITFKIGSISDLDFIKNTIIDHEVNIIIHLISSIIASSSTKAFYDGMENVVIPTFKLIDFIADKGIKFIFFSSGGTVYGNSELVISESKTLDPINNYGYSKLIIENYIQLKSNTSDFDYIILRPSNVYGRYQLFESNQGFISVAIHKVYQDIPIEIWGDGNVIRDYVDVVDVVDVLHQLLLCDASNVTLNLSTGVGFSLLQVIAVIENYLDKQALMHFNNKRIVDASTVILDNSKLSSLVDHNFIKIHDGIKNQIKYYKTTLDNAN